VAEGSRSSRGDGKPFRCTVEPRRDVVRVALEGELDIASVGEVKAQLRQLHDAGFGHFVLDLRELTFIDSTGLRLILSENTAAREKGGCLELVAGPPEVQRVFELTAVLDHLTFRGW
jgi:anti-sigma B factor antagonist